MTQAKAQAQKEGKHSFFLYMCLCLRLPCSHIVCACACIIHVNIPFSVVTVTLACMQTSSAPAKIGKEIFAGGEDVCTQATVTPDWKEQENTHLVYELVTIHYTSISKQRKINYHERIFSQFQ